MNFKLIGLTQGLVAGFLFVLPPVSYAQIDFDKESEKFCEFYEPIIADKMKSNVFWQKQVAEKYGTEKEEASNYAQQSLNLLKLLAPIYASYCKDR